MLFSLIPGISPITPITSIIPVVFILVSNLLVDGFEDFLRGVSDWRANASKYIVVRKGVEKSTESKSICVGDIVKVVNNQEIPVDLLIIASSNFKNTCHIETANLDGETNLKVKKGLNFFDSKSEGGLTLERLKEPKKPEAPSDTTSQVSTNNPNIPLRSSVPSNRNKLVEALYTITRKGIVKCSPPNAKFSSFSASLFIPGKNFADFYKYFSNDSQPGKATTITSPLDSAGSPIKSAASNHDLSLQPLGETLPLSASPGTISIDSTAPLVPPMESQEKEQEYESKVYPLEINNLLLRGSKLKNTACVYGVAVYTGTNTKLFMNMKKTGAKPSYLDSTVNSILMILIIAQQALASLFVIFEFFLNYFFVSSDNYLGKYYGYGKPGIIFPISSYLTEFILLNYFIPMSLFVSLEFVKGIQGFFMQFDLKMRKTPPQLKEGEVLKKKKRFFLTECCMRCTNLLFYQDFYHVPDFDDDENFTSSVTAANAAAAEANPEKFTKPLTRRRRRKYIPKFFVHSSVLNTDLSQIQIVFCDKTGTLTENKMEFKNCCVKKYADEFSLFDEMEERGSVKKKYFALNGIIQKTENSQIFGVETTSEGIGLGVEPENAGASSSPGFFLF